MAPNIRNHAIEEMSKEELNVFLRSFCTSAWKKDDTLSVYKSSSKKFIWEPPLIVCTCKPDIHCALAAQWTCAKVMKEQWEKNECFHTFRTNFEKFILCIPEHLFSCTLKFLSVDVFRFCSIKKPRTFKNQNQFQILSRPLNRTLNGFQDAY